MDRYKCLSCETIITSKRFPIKCSCGSNNIEEYIMSKNELFSLLDNQMNKLDDENPFHREFLVEEREEEESIKKLLLSCYEDIRMIIEKYLDLDEKHIKIISLWIIGTYFHNDFNSYPYLYLNAMRGSGKTRLLNLIAAMSLDGSVQNSLTDAVLFRTKGTLCIDEAEGFGKKGKETLMELLNSAYKKGTKVRRMKKKKINGEEQQVVEEFELYRPISIANITGIDSVLGDRCIKIVMEKSVNEKKTRLIENLLEKRILSVKEILRTISKIQCSLCSVVTPESLSKEWNSYILGNVSSLNYITTLNTLNTLTTLKKSFEMIKETTINGRDLELSFPLLIISMWIEGGDGVEGIFEEILKFLDQIAQTKKEEERVENIDISLVDFISQELESLFYISIQEITDKFRNYLQTNDDWLNTRWMGRALTRLKLTKGKRRLSRGVEVQLDYKKAKENIKMFK